MATIQILDNFSNPNPDLMQVAYTAGAFPVVIEAFTASNTSLVNAAYSSAIRSTAGILQPQVQSQIVIWGENDLAIGIVNQVIPAGGSLSIETTAINSIYFTVTGREITG